MAHWKSVANRRKFFVDLAHERGFEPLEAHKWYPLTLEEVLDNKVKQEKRKYYFDNFK